jgi:hypothetical protein
VLTLQQRTLCLSVAVEVPTQNNYYIFIKSFRSPSYEPNEIIPKKFCYNLLFMHHIVVLHFNILADICVFGSVH